MTPASLTIAALFGSVLALNLEISRLLKTRSGPRAGRVFWSLNVALPAGIMLAIVPTYALVGVAVSAVITLTIQGAHQLSRVPNS